MEAAEKILPKTMSIVTQGRDDGLHLGAQFYISRHGKVIADFGWGVATSDSPGSVPDWSAVEMDINSINLWLSSGKPLTALAIAQLSESQKLSIDDSISRFIPEFAQHDKGAITVKHLLTHTAGFRAADQLSPELPWDDRVQKICATALEPDWIPGNKAGYHTTSSWFILGEIVKRISGRPLEQYLREEILLPLEMNDCWVGMPADKFDEYHRQNRLATMFVRENNEMRPRSYLNSKASFTTCRPGSNACGPIRELGRLYEFLLGFVEPKKPILKQATIQQFTSPQRVGMYDQTFMHKIDFGLGFIVNSNRYGMETLPYGYGRYASEETFGHSGAQSSAGFADPKHGLAVAWVCNCMAGERKHQKRAKEINSAIYQDLGIQG